MRRGVLIAAFAGFLIGGGTAQASHVPCPPPPSQYDDGGSPGTRFPDDPLFAEQWGARMINAPAAWARGARGAGAVIAVVDSGVDLAHPDLRDRLVPGVDLSEGGPDEAPDCPPGPQDSDGHGTTVAGVAAAATNNGIGIAGVAPAARVMPIKVGHGSETPVLDDTLQRDRFAEGIRYAADHGADVINVAHAWSYRTLDPTWIDTYERAARYAWERGSLVVAVAGNRSMPGCEQPAAAPTVVCVTAVKPDGTRADYSNLAIHSGGGISVAAPGGTSDCAGDAWTTTLPSAPKLCPGTPAGYDRSWGTTIASAHVSGVAAMLAGKGLSNQEIVDCLRETSSGEGTFSVMTGYGIVDADAATARCAAPPRGGRHG